MTTCSKCRNTKPGPMSLHGFQSCRLDMAYFFYPGKHSCVKYEPKPQAPDKPSTAARDLFVANRKAGVTA